MVQKQLDIHMQKMNLDLYLTPFRQIILKQITDLCKMQNYKIPKR